MVIYWATRLRGFLKHISSNMENVEFCNSNTYEVSGRLHKIKSKLIRSRLFDPIGLFQIIDISGKDCDGYGSFNRFLRADKPYFIYLENPTALYNYALGRINRGLGRKRFAQCLNDKNLKYIVCMSNACRTTFEKLNMSLPEHVQIKTIYPFVPENVHASHERIHKKSFAPVLECLYCVQGKSFYTKGGDEVLNAVINLQNAGCKIHLTVITNLDALRQDTMTLIENCEGITLHDFTFSYEDLEKVYADTAVLLQPSSADSFGLSVLEAMKGGCAVLGSKLYAFPEMVEHNVNGLLIEPKYWTFTPDNMPNPVAWGYERKVRLAAKKNEKYAADIETTLRNMYEDRDMLFAFAKKSLEIANTKFGTDRICKQWQNVWNALKGLGDDET